MNPTIRITRYANVLHIDPPVFDLIKPAVTYTYRKHLATYAERKQASRITGDPNASSLYFEKHLAWFERDQLYAFAGLYRRIAEHLRKNGYRFEFLNRLPERPDPNYARLRGHSITGSQKGVIAAIAAADMGIISAPPGYGKSYLISRICSVFDKERIVVVTNRRMVARQLYASIAELLGDCEVGRAWTGHNDVHKRVVVAVIDSLGKVELKKLSMVLFDEVHTAASPEHSSTLVRISNARFYGFSATPFGRSDNADLLTEALFGPVIYEIDYTNAQSEGRVVPVVVRMYTISGCTVERDSSTYMLNRYGIWCNDCRNSYIARVVRDIEQELDGQILILCDKGMHVYHLQQFLRDYIPVVGNISENVKNYLRKRGLIPDDFAPLTPKQLDELADRFASGEIRKAIATSIWDTGFDVPGLACVVRADGRSGAIIDVQRPGRVTRIADGKEAGLVVDFYDDYHTTLRNRSRRRMTAYRKLGWRIVRR